jgi:hypothetical protein
MARNIAYCILVVLCLVLRFVWLLLLPKAVRAAKLMATQSQRRAIHRNAPARASEPHHSAESEAPRASAPRVRRGLPSRGAAASGAGGRDARAIRTAGCDRADEARLTAGPGWTASHLRESCGVAPQPPITTANARSLQQSGECAQSLPRYRGRNGCGVRIEWTALFG